MIIFFISWCNNIFVSYTNQSNQSFWSFVLDNSISLLALFIAILVLVTTIVQVYLLKKHNYLSVKPILRFDRSINESKGLIRLDLKNLGCGPAIINKFHYYLDNKIIKNLSPDTLRNFFANHKITLGEFGGGMLYGDDPLSKGEYFNLLDIQLEGNLFSSLNKTDWFDLMSNIKFEITYSSIYGKKQKPLFYVLSQNFPFNTTN